MQSWATVLGRRRDAGAEGRPAPHSAQHAHAQRPLMRSSGERPGPLVQAPVDLFLVPASPGLRRPPPCCVPSLMSHPEGSALLTCHLPAALPPHTLLGA